MIVELILAAITAALARSLLQTVQRCKQTFSQLQNRLKLAGLILSCMLLVVAILAWIFTAFIVLNGIIRTLTPSSPAPFILLPWFIGMCLIVFPWQFAEMILNMLRKEDQPPY